jgi:hypothetical protein
MTGTSSSLREALAPTRKTRDAGAPGGPSLCEEARNRKNVDPFDCLQGGLIVVEWETIQGRRMVTLPLGNHGVPIGSRKPGLHPHAGTNLGKERLNLDGLPDLSLCGSGSALLVLPVLGDGYRYVLVDAANPMGC